MRALVLLLTACSPGAPSSPSVAPPRGSFAAGPLDVALPGEAAAPIALVASDGTALTLDRLEARAVVQEPLAWTELHLSFVNPEARVLEGRFQVRVPEGASIARFAMQVNGDWQEGAVVERRRAQQVYEDHLHVRQDPALLEQEAADLFSARVFPIQPHGKVEIVLSWSGELPVEGYTLPLRGLPQLGELDVSAQVKRGATGADGLERSETLALHQSKWTPDHDFSVPNRAERLGLSSGDYVVARVTPALEAPPDPVDALCVLVDSSASRALTWDADITRIQALAASLAAGAGPSTPLAVVAFDQGVTPIFEGTAGEFGDDDAQRLRDLLPLGASDPAAALGWLGDHLRAEHRRYDRVLLITDATPTAGARDPAVIRDAAKALASVEVERIDVLASGGLLDEAAARLLVTSGLAHDGVVVRAREGLPAVARKLERTALSGVPVTAEGADWVWPETLDAIQPGDQAFVYARVPTGAPLRLSIAGKPVDGTIDAGEAPLVDRAAAQARVARLVALRDTRHAHDPDIRDALAKQATEISLSSRVLSPWTAMLVLEGWWDYQRYGIEQPATVVSVGPAGLVDEDRPQPDSFGGWRLGFGGLGATGTGLGGGGTRSAGIRGLIGAKSASPAMDGVEAAASTGASGVAGGQATGEPELKVDGGLFPDIPAAGKALERRVAQAPAPDEEPAEEVAASARDAAKSAAEKARKAPRVAAWSGRYAEVEAAIRRGDARGALATAKAWRVESPGDVLALLALGDAFASVGEPGQAARAYGSLIDLFPSRADLRRAAGNHLESLDAPAAHALALDTYRVAREQRPDHPTSHRMYAFALARSGRHAEAFDVIVDAQRQGYRWDQEAGIRPVLREDAAILGAVLAHAEPTRREEVVQRLAALGLVIADQPSTRFVLTWETDANDVDLHVRDGKGDESWFAHRALASGGALHLGVFNGYGPECFTLSGPATAWPYHFDAHYYRRGPMGYGMGKLEIVSHDGHGGLRFDERPYVVMNDNAWVDLGSLKEPLG